MTQVVIVGAGGQGRLIADALISQKVAIHGFIDPSFEVGVLVGGIPILGGDDWTRSHPEAVIAIGIGATQETSQRMELYNRFKSYRIIGCLHESAIVGTAVKIHDTAQIMANCLLNHSSFVGENVVIHSGGIIEHDAVIEAHSYLSPRVTFCGNVRIGPRVFIGASSTIIQNISIGEGATIAAGSVVTRDVPPNSLVMGVPARVVESR
jgi:sugar O-acyltransferase (sialic acid O-acetyltransferase NeuD family)